MQFQQSEYQCYAVADPGRDGREVEGDRVPNTQTSLGGSLEG